MKPIRIEFDDMQLKSCMRPGRYILHLTNPQLHAFDTQELLGQMDIKDVMEWLSEQGYTVHREAA